MSDAADIATKFQMALKPHIKPRDQVNYIRRILALHIASKAYGGPTKYPWALADGSHLDEETAGAQSLEKDYYEAVRAHEAARSRFDSAAQPSNEYDLPEKHDVPSNQQTLEDRLDHLKLGQKQAHLREVETHLDILMRKPAGSQEYLDEKRLFQHATRLPAMPKEVLSSLVVQKSSTEPDLNERLLGLEKTVLRANVLLKQQEQLLQDARHRSGNRGSKFSYAERLRALNSTRNELISWIEGELGKAAPDEADNGNSANSQAAQSTHDQASMAEDLAQIKIKYGQYVQYRQSLLSLLRQSHEQDAKQPKPRLQPASEEKIGESGSQAVEYLLTPYIENLVATSRNLKAMIAQKSHMQTALSSQTANACQVINHLAEESQLLPQHPSQNSTRRKSVIREDSSAKSAERSKLSGRIEPWVFAGDAAKIETLETVTESVEGGQVALEGFMRNLDAIRRLLGQHDKEAGEQEQDTSQLTEKDVWLGGGSDEPIKSRKHTEAPVEASNENDVWSRINGDLGLISRNE